MLGPADVGHRVVVRRLVDPAPTRTGRQMMTDALGVLTAITESELTIDTDAGRLTIPRTAVVAAKRIPARPARRPPN